MDFERLKYLMEQKESVERFIAIERKKIFDWLVDNEYDETTDRKTGFVAQLVDNPPRRSMKYSELEKDLPLMYDKLINLKYISISVPKTEKKLVIRKPKDSDK